MTRAPRASGRRRLLVANMAGILAVLAAIGASAASISAARTPGLAGRELRAIARPRLGDLQGQMPVSADQINAAIDKLAVFDFPVRTAAARTVRRAPAAIAVPALARAARGHRDEYVRYRALVILAGIGDNAVRDVVADVLADRNDRLRAVAYSWIEHHPDPAMLPTLLSALISEQSEFVRPALTRAVAAHGTDPRARAAMVPLVMRGEDFFRGAAIEALGDHQGQYALPEIIAVANLEGPLQDDAITAIGKLGGATARPALGALQKSAPADVQPTISAALCLIGVDCPQQSAYLHKTLTFAATSVGFQPLLRSVVHGLGLLAVRNDREAIAALLDAGVPAQDPARAPIALGLGLVALRNPLMVLGTFETRKDLNGAIELLRDAFDMFSEDYEEERFYVEIRRAYWAAAEGSVRRRVAETMLDKLEFS